MRFALSGSRRLQRRDSLSGHEFPDLVRDRLRNLPRLLLWFHFAHNEFGCGNVGISRGNTSRQVPARAFAVKTQERRVRIRAGIHFYADLQLTLPGAETNTRLHRAIARVYLDEFAGDDR
jgi:hypothetical protein